MTEKILSIKERLLYLMKRNSEVLELEKLDKEEFIIDFNAKERLITQSELLTKKVRTDIEEENMKKRVIRNRIKVRFIKSIASVQNN
jgi:hypothetical protein